MPLSLTQLNSLPPQELDLLIRSERNRLIDNHIENISPTIFAAFSVKYNALIANLNRNLDRAGRTRSLDQDTSRLGLLPMPALTTIIDQHQQIVAQMTYLKEFISAEGTRLIQNEADEISADYYEACAKLQISQIDEIKVYLRIKPSDLLFAKLNNAGRQSAPLPSAPSSLFFEPKLETNSPMKVRNPTIITPPPPPPLNYELECTKNKLREDQRKLNARCTKNAEEEEEEEGLIFSFEH